MAFSAKLHHQGDPLPNCFNSAGYSDAESLYESDQQQSLDLIKHNHLHFLLITIILRQNYGMHPQERFIKAIQEITPQPNQEDLRHKPEKITEITGLQIWYDPGI